MRGLARRLASVAGVTLLLVGTLPPAGVRAADPVTVDFTVASRAYDGTASATITGCTLTGVTAPADVTCVLSGATATFADPLVGAAKPVTGSGFTLGGADAANYEITTVNGTVADITPGLQAITFAAAPTGVVVGGSGFSVSASASSGLAVTYSSTTSGICSVDAATGALSLLAAGTCAIAADQAGDANWSAAPQVTQSFAVAAVACRLQSRCRPSP